MEDNDLDKPKSLIIFGRDVTKIPCFKYSWIYGITSGFGAGLLTFMFTSQVRLSTHMVVGTMGVVTLTYFGICRYQFLKNQLVANQIKEVLQEVMAADQTNQKNDTK